MSTTISDIEIESDRLSRRWGVRPIWYKKTPGHPQLEALIRQLQYEAGTRQRDILFVEHVADVHKLGFLTNPTEAQIAQVVQALRVPETARHFFRTADSPAWYQPLLEAGILEAVSEPREVSPGLRQIPAWAAGPYISRIAVQKPDAVAELTQRFRDTKNWRVVHTLMDLANLLSDEHLRQVLPVYVFWMKSPEQGYDLISHDLVNVIEQLHERLSIQLAIDVYEQLIKLRGHEIESKGDIEFWVERHDLSRLLDILPALATAAPQRMYELMISTLEGAQAQLPSWQRSCYWRSAISQHQADAMASEETLNFLITGTRDALLALVHEDVAAGGEAVEKLILSRERLQYRLALHALVQVPETIDHLTVSPFDEARFWNQNRDHELSVFLNQRFDQLQETDREYVHAVIANGPPVEEVDVSKEDRKQEVDRWNWRWIGSIPPQFRTPDEQKKWEEVRHISDGTPPYSIPPSRSDLIFETTSDSTDIVQELQQAYETGPQELLAALRRNQRWGPLDTLIMNDPLGLVELAAHIQPEDFDFLASYFGAFHDMLRQSKLIFPWTPMIELMERVAIEADPQRLTGMMWLLRDGLINRIPDDLLVRSLHIAANVLSRTASSPDRALSLEGGIRFHQINTAAGQAAESFMLCIWRMAKVDEPDLRGIPESAKPLIEDAVATGWGGLELRYSIGEHFGTLDWCQPGWLASNIIHLAPDGPTEESFGRSYAFLHGHLAAGQYTSASMQAVRSFLSRVIPDFGRDEPEYLVERMSAEALVDLVVLGWIFDVEGYGGLLDQLIEVTPDRLRAHAISWSANQVARYPDDETRHRWLIKIDGHWSRRVEALSSLPATTPSEELASFILWARRSDSALVDVEDRLNVSIDHLPPNYGVYQVFEYLAERATYESEAAARLLRRLVERWSGNRDSFVVPYEKVYAVIAAICEGDEGYHEDLVAAIDRLVEDGWTNLLGRLDDWNLSDYFNSYS